MDKLLPALLAAVLSHCPSARQKKGFDRAGTFLYYKKAARMGQVSGRMERKRQDRRPEKQERDTTETQ